MRSKVIFMVSGIGLVLALRQRLSSPASSRKSLPPAFNPAANPYAKGIYANGIIESVQAPGREHQYLSGSHRTDHASVWSREGAKVHKGDLLLTIDDSVQRATAEQLAVAGRGGARHARGAQGGTAA